MKPRLLLALTLPVLVMAGLVLVPDTALAGNITANQIWSNLTGKYVIAVPGASTSNGVQLETYASQGHPDQFWRFDYTQYGYQQIINVNSGKCMGVSGGSLSAGATIVQWTCDGSLNQYWRLGGPDGAYAYDTLINDNSGMCVGISGNSTSEGAKLVQWACDGNYDKQWIPDSAPWPYGDQSGHPWYACYLTRYGCNDTDPINVLFNDPNRQALGDITSDLEAKGWGTTSCYDANVKYNNGGGLASPNAVLATDVSNGGCGACGSTRDHVRIWISPDGHTAFMAASIEQTNCVGGIFTGHSLVSFNDGRNRLINDEDNRLTGRTYFISNEVMQYPASSFSGSGVSFDGWIGVFDIGA
jgi:Ricin-type beta-trefoil lectin domain